MGKCLVIVFCCDLVSVIVVFVVDHHAPLNTSLWERIHTLGESEIEQI